MNCSNDDFIRTTEERHHRSLRRPSGSGWRRTATSTCRNTPAGTRCATRPTTPRTRRTLTSTRSASAAKTGTPVEWVEEESYFFKLSAYQQKLLDLYAQRARFRAAEGAAERGRELREGRAAGLVDLAHHLRLGHHRCRAIAKHIMYVWVDALTNYITARRASRTPRARNSSATGRPICM